MLLVGADFQSPLFNMQMIPSRGYRRKFLLEKKSVFVRISEGDTNLGFVRSLKALSLSLSLTQLILKFRNPILLFISTLSCSPFPLSFQL
ncbi:hypothetical protein RIF29_31706 [Crotalaria pallida]|uniref:Uncharacterized protein n=1 Tax=Crotalaria pallida TaxID=3830 RepID=A0AAN9HXR5_CROPI